MPRWTIEQLIAHQKKRGLKQDPSLVPTPTPAKRIRQRTAPKLNKIEAEWGGMLRCRPDTSQVRAQAITLALANGVRYTPDWTGWVRNKYDRDRLTCWEVKGPHAWEDSLVKLKVAASTYPDFDFWLVWKEHGEWQMQKVLA